MVPGGEVQRQGSRRVVGARLKQHRRLTGLQAGYLKEHASGHVKMTVPSPSYFTVGSFLPGITDQLYAARSDLLWEFASIIKAEVAALAEDRISYIQTRIPHLAKTSDAVNRQLSCSSSRYMNLLAVLQI